MPNKINWKSFTNPSKRKAKRKSCFSLSNLFGIFYLKTNKPLEESEKKNEINSQSVVLIYSLCVVHR